MTTTVSPRYVRLHRTSGLTTSSAELRALDGERVADAPTWPVDVAGTQHLAQEWAERAAAQLGLVLVRGPLHSLREWRSDRLATAHNADGAIVPISRLLGLEQR